MSLRAAGVTKSFGERRVLGGITLEAADGEFLVLIGPNGCGKTVFLRVIAGLTPPSGGEIRIGGPEDAPITMAFQRSPLFPWMTVRENLHVALNGPGAARRREETAKWLEDARLTPWADLYPHQISGGARQKANVLRCLMGRPRLALMDEPFAALDYLERRRLQSFVADLQRARGTTTVFVTHDIPEALFLADRIAVMSRAGEIAAEFPCPFPKPRRHEALQRETAYLDLHEKISDALSGG